MHGPVLSGPLHPGRHLHCDCDVEATAAVEVCAAGHVVQEGWSAAPWNLHAIEEGKFLGDAGT